MIHSAKARRKATRGGQALLEARRSQPPLKIGLEQALI
jgi:hypothetical protein